MSGSPAPLSRVRSPWIGTLALMLTAAGCANPSAPSGTPASAPQPLPAASAPLRDTDPSAEAPALPAATPASAAPAASGPPAASSAAPAEPEPLPAVQVVNIGMHIGGGPNDSETKAPIKASVQPHFDAFRRCWTSVRDQSKAGDFGVDLLIEAGGGKAAVSHPRTALEGDGFTDCMVKAFEAIDFQKPRKGKTTVSYSLRFTPERK